MSNPLISVLMPAYNVERYIKEAIESILRQDYGNFEFIIINDGSTDNTETIIQSYAMNDRRIKVISRKNTGHTVALNEGLLRAKGYYIARMDADDISLPFRLRCQCHFMEENPDYVAIGGGIERIDEDGWPISTINREKNHNKIDQSHLCGEGGAIIHPTAMIRHETLKMINGYRPMFEPAEDIDLFLRLAEVGKLSNIENVILKYRVNLNGVSRTRTAIQKEKCLLAVKDAKKRRGLSKTHESLEKNTPGTLDFREKIILESIIAGNKKTAVKHFIKTFLDNPVKIFNVKWYLKILLYYLKSEFKKYNIIKSGRVLL